MPHRTANLALFACSWWCVLAACGHATPCTVMQVKLLAAGSMSKNISGPRTVSEAVTGGETLTGGPRAVRRSPAGLRAVRPSSAGPRAVRPSSAGP